MECTLCPSLLWDLAVSGLNGLCVDLVSFVLPEGVSQGLIALASGPSVTNYTAPSCSAGLCLGAWGPSHPEKRAVDACCRTCHGARCGTPLPRRGWLKWAMQALLKTKQPARRVLLQYL